MAAPDHLVGDDEGIRPAPPRSPLPLPPATPLALALSPSSPPHPMHSSPCHRRRRGHRRPRAALPRPGASPSSSSSNPRRRSSRGASHRRHALLSSPAPTRITPTITTAPLHPAPPRATPRHRCEKRRTSPSILPLDLLLLLLAPPLPTLIAAALLCRRGRCLRNSRPSITSYSWHPQEPGEPARCLCPAPSPSCGRARLRPPPLRSCYSPGLRAPTR